MNRSPESESTARGGNPVAQEGAPRPRWLERALAWGRGIHLPLAIFLVAGVLQQVVIVGQLGNALSLGADRLVLGTIGLLLLTMPILLRRGGRRQLVRLVVLDLVLVAISLVDLVHYRAFGDLSSVAQLRFVGLLGDVGDSVLGFVGASDLLLLASGAVLGILALFLPRSSWKPLRLRAIGVFAGIGVFLVTGVFLTTPRLKRLRHRGNAFLAGELGIVGYHFWEVATYLAQRAERLVPDPALRARTRARLAELGQNARANRPALWAAARGRNVIVLQLESFQAFTVGMEVGGVKVAPNLEALAKESVRVPAFFNQTAQGRTSDAQFAVNCSLYPSATGAVAFEYVHDDFRCLPTVLQDEGYATVFMHAHTPAFWNRAAFNPKQGFERSLDMRDFDLDDMIGIGLSDRSFFRQAVDHLKRLPEPYYAFLVSLTSHTPFGFPELPRTLPLGELKGTVVGDYLDAVHYTDGAVGALVARLRDEGILDRSVLVVYGDHDGVTHRWTDIDQVMGVDSEDLWALGKLERQVPLFIRLPNGEGAGEVARLGGEIDLAPTILDLLGVDRAGTTFLGQSLLVPPADGARMVAFPDGSARTVDHLYLATGAAEPRCFGPGGARPVGDCASLRDRAERDLSISHGILEKNLVPALTTPAVAAHQR